MEKNIELWKKGGLMDNYDCKWEQAFHILMEYSEDLPDCDNEEIEKRLKAIGIF